MDVIRKSFKTKVIGFYSWNTVHCVYNILFQILILTYFVLVGIKAYYLQRFFEFSKYLKFLLGPILPIIEFDLDFRPFRIQLFAK